MGQYYVAVILDEDSTPTHVARSWDFNNGAKLMEHSWLNNNFVAAVETLLVAEAPVRVVWAGDYADPEPFDRPNLYTQTDELEGYRPDIAGLGEQINWINDQRIITIDPEIKANAWPVIIPRTEAYPFLINWDKKLYVDKRNVPADGDGWTVHPLPLLTVEGNGRGGGDYRGSDSVISSWARDHISLATHAPHGFTELPFNIFDR